MSKDKRRKKLFQGIEHLQQTVTQQQVSTVVQPGETAPAETYEQHEVRRDLFKVLILVSILLAVLFGLLYYDKTSGGLGVFAEKIGKFLNI